MNTDSHKQTFGVILVTYKHQYMLPNCHNNNVSTCHYCFHYYFMVEKLHKEIKFLKITKASKLLRKSSNPVSLAPIFLLIIKLEHQEWCRDRCRFLIRFLDSVKVLNCLPGRGGYVLI